MITCFSIFQEKGFFLGGGGALHCQAGSSGPGSPSTFPIKRQWGRFFPPDASSRWKARLANLSPQSFHIRHLLRIPRLPLQLISLSSPSDRAKLSFHPSWRQLLSGTFSIMVTIKKMWVGALLQHHTPHTTETCLR